jgi:hypothetical protein
MQACVYARARGHLLPTLATSAARPPGRVARVWCAQRGPRCVPLWQACAVGAGGGGGRARVCCDPHCTCSAARSPHLRPHAPCVLCGAAQCTADGVRLVRCQASSAAVCHSCLVCVRVWLCVRACAPQYAGGHRLAKPVLQWLYTVSTLTRSVQPAQQHVPRPLHTQASARLGIHAPRAAAVCATVGVFRACRFLPELPYFVPLTHGMRPSCRPVLAAPHWQQALPTPVGLQRLAHSPPIYRLCVQPVHSVLWGTPTPSFRLMTVCRWAVARAARLGCTYLPATAPNLLADGACLWVLACCTASPCRTRTRSCGCSYSGSTRACHARCGPHMHPNAGQATAKVREGRCVRSAVQQVSWTPARTGREGLCSLVLWLWRQQQQRKQWQQEWRQQEWRQQEWRWRLRQVHPVGRVCAAQHTAPPHVAATVLLRVLWCGCSVGSSCTKR